MKKKGFTLVELLAVIAILAILVLIALPNVLRMFRNAKENTFVTEVQEIIKTAEQGYISGSLSNKDCKCFSSSSNPLDLNGRNNIQYYVEFNNEGKINKLVVVDDEYQLIINEEVKVGDIGSSTSNKKNKSETLKSDTEVPECNGKKPALKTYNANITSENECIKSDEICTSGTKVSVQVNDSEKYDFYVLSDDGDKLTMILNKNIATSAWTSKSSYVHECDENECTSVKDTCSDKENQCENQCNPDDGEDAYDHCIGECGDVLSDCMSGYENCYNRCENNYVYNGAYSYPAFDVTKKLPLKSNWKNVSDIRLLTLEEAQKAGCVVNTTPCPSWLFENNTDSYWLISPFDASLYFSYYDSNKNFASYIDSSGNLDGKIISETLGVRPVIEINKAVN